MKKIIVDKKFNEKNLISFLLNNFNGLTLNMVYKTLRKKDVRINNIKVSQNCNINTGDEITIFIDDKFLYKNLDLDIIYEDDNIIIVNKPIGIEIISNNANEMTLTSLLQKHYNSSNDYPRPCHRLDRNTSGIILYAKNEITLNILLEKFKNREIEKCYKCTVYGIPSKKEDTLIAYLFKDRKNSLVYISDVPKKGYQKIITSYNVLSESPKDNTSVLDVCLHTGRTHQIRAHLAHIGYPIIGDR